MARFTNHHQGPELTYCRMAVFAVVTLSVLIFLVYSNSFHCSWHFDDTPNITDNPLLHMTKISWPSIKSAIFSDRNNPATPYRPVACLSLALNHYFGGLHVAGYHLVNILIHLISSIYLFLFIYRTLTLPTLKRKYESHAYFIALLATVLWAINPIQTQAITYIVQRMASLAAMFCIIAMYFYLRARTADTTARKAVFFATCGVSFFLAMGSKENAAMLPPSVLIYDILFLQENPLDFFRNNLLKFLVALGLTLLIGIVYLSSKTGSVLSFLDGYENRPFTVGQRLLTEPRIILFYISLIFYPMPNRLNLAHDITISTSLMHPVSTFFSILIIAGSIAGALLLSRKRPFISFAILFFFLNHLIESSIFPLELIFEHRNYLPSMFLFVPVAIGLHYLLNSFAQKKVMATVLCSFIILLLIGFGHSTFVRNFIWKNEMALWIDAVEKSPNLFRPHHNLGNHYQDSGDINNAIAEYQKALSSKTLIGDKLKALSAYNLGLLYKKLDKPSKAISYYESAIKIDPNFGPTWINLASIFDEKGMPKKAHYYLKEASKRWTDDPYLTFNLALMSLRNGKTTKAISYFEQINGDKSLHKQTAFYLGIAYEKSRSFGLAALNFQKSIKYHIRILDAYLHLAVIYESVSNSRMAEKNANKALDIMASNNKLFEPTMNLLFRPNETNQFLRPSNKMLSTVLMRAIKNRKALLCKWKKSLVKIYQ